MVWLELTAVLLTILLLMGLLFGHLELREEIHHLKLLVADLQQAAAASIRRRWLRSGSRRRPRP